jgi:proton-dependent oligopeptide transporter, POT family
MSADRTLGDIGMQPSGTEQERRAAVRYLMIGFGVLALIVLGVSLSGLTPLDIAQNMSYVMAALALSYFAYMFFGAGLNTDEMKRVAVIIVLFVFATIFWSAFEQAPTSLNLFAADYTDRVIGGWEMPILWLQSANSFFVIALAPVFAALWVSLARRRGDLSSPAKFALGLFFAAIGFAIMIYAARAVLAGGEGFRVSPWWLVASYFFQTIGELCLSPVGLSSMTKLSPRRFTGQMMGVWFMAAAMGNLIAGIVGGHVDPENPQQMPALFERTTISLLIATAVLAALIVPIRRMMAEKPAATS